MWFQPLEFAFPAMLLVLSTCVIGGFFVALAWAQISADWAKVAPGKPRKALGAFTASVLLGAVSIFTLPLFLARSDLGIFIALSILAASLVLLIIAVVLTYGSRGMVKTGSRVLLVINLPLFILVIQGLAH